MRCSDSPGRKSKETGFGRSLLAGETCKGEPGFPIPSRPRSLCSRGRPGYPFFRTGCSKGRKRFSFFVYPTIQFFDGRSSSRPFLQELPDP
jgi:hypothetical protein